MVLGRSANRATSKGVVGPAHPVRNPVDILPGDELEQRFFVTDAQEIQNSFQEQWTDRWNARANLRSEDWKRIVDFTMAYVPRHALIF